MKKIILLSVIILGIAIFSCQKDKSVPPPLELMDQLRHTKLDATQHYLKKHCGIVNDRIRDNFPSPI